MDEMVRSQQTELERISSLTRDEAKGIILERVENELSHDIAIMVREHETRAKEDADKKAKEVLSLAIQRCAAEHVAETTVSVVNLPNDEMKGRIIGREGRNIRTLETLTGIDLIIDDTPEAVILSGFDPIRRETARIALRNWSRMDVSTLHELKKWWTNPVVKWMNISARLVSRPHSK